MSSLVYSLVGQDVKGKAIAYDAVQYAIDGQQSTVGYLQVLFNDGRVDMWTDSLHMGDQC